MRYTLASLFMSFILIISSCGCSKVENRQTSPYDEAVQSKEIILDINEDTITQIGLTFTLENISKKTYTFGEDFFLDMRVDDEWYAVPLIDEEQFAFNDIGFELAAHSKTEIKIDWKHFYGKLKSGTYRLIKPVLYVEEPGDYETYSLIEVFKISSD